MQNNPMNFFTGTRGKRRIIIVVVVIIGLIGFFTGVRQVGTGKIGVVTQYGKVVGRELTEGLGFVVPYGVNDVSVYDIKVQKEVADTQAATKDLQDVTAEVVLNYHLNRGEVSKIHQTVGEMYKDRVITPALSETFKGASAKYNASELITERATLKKDVYDQLHERLGKYGVIVDDVSITNFKFSDSFAKAIEDKQVAQQNAERAKFNLEAAQTDAQSQAAQAQTLSDNYLRKLAIDKWDGKMPSTVAGDGTVFSIPTR
ncbi:MAG: prohibitin family protein [Candidatus Saccharimonadales bacterium]